MHLKIKLFDSHRPSNFLGSLVMQGYETARKDAEAPMASSDGCEWFVVKLSVMIGLICLDIGLNSSLESDLYKGNADLCFLMLG